MEKVTRWQRKQLHQLTDTGLSLLNVSPEELQNLMESPAWQLVIDAYWKFMRYLEECAKKPIPTASTDAQVEVIVDYDQPLEPAIAAGGYSQVHVGFKNWEYEGDSRTGKHRVVIRFEQYDRTVFRKEILDDFASRGLRPATLHELLALGAQAPSLHLTYAPIIALGTLRLDFDQKGDLVPLLGIVLDRTLDLNKFWSYTKDYRFAAVAL